MAHHLRRQTSLGNGVSQSDLCIRCSIAHEAQLLAVNARFHVDLGDAGNLAAHAQFGELGHGLDAGASFAQRSLYRRQIITNARDNARTRDHYAFFHAAVP